MRTQSFNLRSAGGHARELPEVGSDSELLKHAEIIDADVGFHNLAIRDVVDSDPLENDFLVCREVSP